VFSLQKGLIGILVTILTRIIWVSWSDLFVSCKCYS